MGVPGWLMAVFGYLYQLWISFYVPICFSHGSFKCMHQTLMCSVVGLRYVKVMWKVVWDSSFVMYLDGSLSVEVRFHSYQTESALCFV